LGEGFGGGAEVGAVVLLGGPGFVAGVLDEFFTQGWREAGGVEAGVASGLGSDVVVGAEGAGAPGEKEIVLVGVEDVELAGDVFERGLEVVGRGNGWAEEDDGLR
jgi:hypothetical protein